MFLIQISLLNNEQKQIYHRKQTQSDGEAAEPLEAVRSRENPDFIDQDAAAVKFCISVHNKSLGGKDKYKQQHAEKLFV